MTMRVVSSHRAPRILVALIVARAAAVVVQCHPVHTPHHHTVRNHLTVVIEERKVVEEVDGIASEAAGVGPGHTHRLPPQDRIHPQTLVGDARSPHQRTNVVEMGHHLMGPGEIEKGMMTTPGMMVRLPRPTRLTREEVKGAVYQNHHAERKVIAVADRTRPPVLDPPVVRGVATNLLRTNRMVMIRSWSVAAKRRGADHHLIHLHPARALHHPEKNLQVEARRGVVMIGSEAEE